AGLLRPQVGGCDPLKIGQGHRQYSIAALFPLLAGAPKEFRMQGTLYLTSRRTGLINTADDAEDCFCNGLPDVRAAMKPVEHRIKLIQCIRQARIPVRVETECSAVIILIGSSAVGATLLANRAMQEPVTQESSQHGQHCGIRVIS